MREKIRFSFAILMATLLFWIPVLYDSIRANKWRFASTAWLVLLLTIMFLSLVSCQKDDDVLPECPCKEYAVANETATVNLRTCYPGIDPDADEIPQSLEQARAMERESDCR